jgi:hypothetical protein
VEALENPVITPKSHEIVTIEVVAAERLGDV